MSYETTFDRPTKAHLVVRTATGEEWEPDAEDLRAFGLIDHLYVAHLTGQLERLLDYEFRDTRAGHDDEAVQRARDAVDLALMLCTDTFLHFDDDPFADDEMREYVARLAALLDTNGPAADDTP